MKIHKKAFMYLTVPAKKMRASVKMMQSKVKNQNQNNPNNKNLSQFCQ
jgi:hypothetical protein